MFGAFVIRGMSGFGAGMIGIPLLAFLMPVHTAVAMFGLMVLVLFAFLSIRDWGDGGEGGVEAADRCRRCSASWAACCCSSTSTTACCCNCWADSSIAYSLYALAVHYIGLPQFTCSQRWAFPVAFVGAFIDTLFGGGGGTLVVIYLHARGVGRAQFRATVAVLWLLEMIARILGYGAAGYYTTDILLLCALLLPLMAAGTWVGERLGNRISQETFSKLMALLLLLTGASLLVK